MTLWGWIVAYLSRWLPHAVEPGLRKVGNPNPDSPVIVTSNFSLTVKRVTRSLREQNIWLLVVNSGGINVWCAATGGMFTQNRVVDALKVMDLAQKVTHRQIILPALAAPGIDRKTILEETGFRAHFGPVQAQDIPAYLKAGYKKTDPMRRFKFDLKHRLDMIISMNFPIWVVLSVVLAVFWPHYLLGTTAIFWFALVMLYIFLDFIPGRTGWSQAMFTASLFIGAWLLLDWFRIGKPLEHWGWFIASFAIFFAAGLDLAGITTGRKSDPEQLMLKLGFKSLGSLFSEKDHGELHLDRSKCSGCKNCQDICPIGVFGELEAEKKMSLEAPAQCFACTACVKQCPEAALSLQP
ncbi:HgcAB-like fusion protein [candidate division CSSED10-310 bacterium]|uniref:HgcAB-like fusion protein n=1 Tax=candidate division CSSED10-310 bacterium TaxID=2855610 RepID=A0ABV6YT56_UNCC1